MKTVFLCLIVLVACSSSKRSYDWDTGAGKSGSFNEIQREESSEAVRNQFPSSQQHTEESANPL